MLCVSCRYAADTPLRAFTRYADVAADDILITRYMARRLIRRFAPRAPPR